MPYKYAQLEDYLKSRILSDGLKSGDKIDSEADLTRKFGISRQTVRAAIADLVKSGYLYTVHGKGTFVRGAAAQKERSYILGLAPQYFKVYNIFPRIMDGINEQIKGEGYNLILAETQNTFAGERSCLQNFLNRDLDGLIMEPCKTMLPNPNLDLYEEFRRRGLPVLFFNGFRSELDCSYVVADDEGGGYACTKYLLDKGHRKLCAFFKFDDQQGHNRFKGMARALMERGLLPSERHISWFSTEDYPLFWEEEEREENRFVGQMLEFAKDCTAVIAYNDFIAVKILKILKKHGIRVPEDISLVSFDDTDITAPFGIGITSVEHPGYAMGRELGKGILELLQNPGQSVRQVLPCGLRPRDSVKTLSGPDGEENA